MPTWSQAIPKVSGVEVTFFSPAFRIRSAKPSGDSKFATDFGRYEYASRLETSAPIRGRMWLK